MLGLSSRHSSFHEVLDDRNREDRAPQDATWPGERVVVWTYTGRPALAAVLTGLRGDQEFGADELVVTDFGDGSSALYLEVAAGHRRVDDLPFREVEGVTLLDLPPDFARAHPGALRKLLWLLPHESIYFVTHESVDPRNQS